MEMPKECTTMWSLIFVYMLLQGAIIGGLPKDYCQKLEKIRPNLVLDSDATISGKITDMFDVPLENSQVELRQYVNEREQTSVTVVRTDLSGRFSLGEIKRGKYRLLASPNRAFRQPELLHCSGGTCEFSIKLQVKSTDGPDSACLVR